MNVVSCRVVVRTAVVKRRLLFPSVVFLFAGMVMHRTKQASLMTDRVRFSEKTQKGGKGGAVVGVGCKATCSCAAAGRQMNLNRCMQWANKGLIKY